MAETEVCETEVFLRLAMETEVIREDGDGKKRLGRDPFPHLGRRSLFSAILTTTEKPCGPAKDVCVVVPVPRPAAPEVARVVRGVELERPVLGYAPPTENVPTARGRPDQPPVRAAKKGRRLVPAASDRVETSSTREVGGVLPNKAGGGKLRKAGSGVGKRPEEAPAEGKRPAHRPAKVGKPWEAMVPPISKAEYYRRKKAGGA